MKTQTLFDVGPRKPRRVLMHVIDCATDCPEEDEHNSHDCVRLECGKCGHQTDWQTIPRRDAKRGVPCPKCNAAKGGA